MDRRKFILEAGRLFLLGGIVAVSGFLIANRTSGDQQSCSFSPVCDRCRKVTSCAKVPENQIRDNGK